MRTRLRPGERKILETRTHWITVVRPFLDFLLAVAIFIVLFIFIHKKSGLLNALRLASTIFLVIAFLYFLYREWYRRRDIWAVTNLRVIDEKGIFSLYSKESPLEKINNISYYQHLIGRLLNYGSIEIQTAAEDGATIYRKVTNPKLLKDTIAKCRDEYSSEMMRQAKVQNQASPEQKSK